MNRAMSIHVLLALCLLSGLAIWGCDDDESVDGLGGNGEIGVYPRPSSDDFPWTLTGPNGFALSDTGVMTLDDMAPGSYTVTWQDMNGWVTPSDNPKVGELSSGSFLSFTGTYTEISGGPVEAGQIVIDVSPGGLMVPWSITGPNAFSESGTGTQTYQDMPPGDYTVTWGDFEGYDKPDPDTVTKTMVEGFGVSFLGEYASIAASELTFVPVLAPGITDSFLMGGGDEFSQINEIPRHRVHLTQSFEMTETEITWAQYERIMGGDNPSIGGCPIGFTCTDLPVENVAWEDAVAFCNAISVLDQYGYTPAYYHTDGSVWDPEVGGDVVWDPDADGFRLPTEAEWEYACRGGTTTAFSSGEGTFSHSSCYDDPALSEVGWYCANSAWPPDQLVDAYNPRIPRAHVVKALLPNDYGLYDMHGNVWEWVWDKNSGYDALPMTIWEYTTPDTVTTDGSAIATLIPGVGQGNLIRFSDICAELAIEDLNLQTLQVSFSYADFDTFANLQINGDNLYIGDLRNPADFPMAIAPGITMTIDHAPITDPALGDGFTGTITLEGPVATIVIGGSNVVIDEIEVVDGDPSDYNHDLLIDFTLSTLGQIFYFDSSLRPSYFGCTVTDPIGRAIGDSHMLRGGGYLNPPRFCRSASRSTSAKGQYAGFRIVRNLD